jgi:nucleoside-diphosphate-sugar epimerase
LVSVFRGSLPAFGVNANAFRDFIYITDVAKALFFLLNDTGHGGYNICSGEPVQIAHVVRTLAQLVGADAQLVLSLASQRQGEPRMLVGENSKLLDTGWHADWTLERGLEAFVQAYPTKKTT